MLTINLAIIFTIVHIKIILAKMVMEIYVIQ